MLNSQSSLHLPFLIACLQFFNKLVGCTHKANGKVYLQYEMELAGFDPANFDKYAYGEGFQFRDLQRELDLWRENYIDVSSKREELSSMEGRNNLLRSEVNRLQQQVKDLEKQNERTEKDHAKLKTKCEEYRHRAATMQDTVEKLNRLFRQKTGRALDDIDDDLDIYGVLQPLDVPRDERYMSVKSTRSISGLSVQSSSAGSFHNADPAGHPAAPAAPPAPPPMFLSQTVRKKVVSKTNLPLLNWTPMYSVRNTVFEDVDDEVLLREIDFSLFEEEFKLPVRKETQETQRKRQKILSVNDDLIRFVDLNRAKNMTITMKKTGLSSPGIRDAIDRCDVHALSGEYAELLLKFIPTKQELKQLALHAPEHEKMAEAEQFLFQLAQVERLETKLSIIAYMGIFDELIDTVTPQMECILKASTSITESERLRKLFEIILAFGNYMNSAKRGYALGFRLDSLKKLDDVKSTDKKKTLMEFLVKMIDEKYPELLMFYQDLDIDVEKGVSYQAIVSDVLGLRKGLDLIKFEREKQSKNEILEDFYERASITILKVADSFKITEDRYREVCLLFGENYKQAEPDDFFKIFTDFITDFKTTAEKTLNRKLPPLKPRRTYSKVKDKSQKPSVERLEQMVAQNATRRSPVALQLSPQIKNRNQSRLSEAEPELPASNSQNVEVDHTKSTYDNNALNANSDKSQNKSSISFSIPRPSYTVSKTDLSSGQRQDGVVSSMSSSDGTYDDALPCSEPGSENNREIYRTDSSSGYYESADSEQLYTEIPADNLLCDKKSNKSAIKQEHRLSKDHSTSSEEGVYDDVIIEKPVVNNIKSSKTPKGKKPHKSKAMKELDIKTPTKDKNILREENISRDMVTTPEVWNALDTLDKVVLDAEMWSDVGMPAGETENSYL